MVINLKKSYICQRRDANDPWTQHFDKPTLTETSEECDSSSAELSEWWECESSELSAPFIFDFGLRRRTFPRTGLTILIAVVFVDTEPGDIVVVVGRGPGYGEVCLELRLVGQNRLNIPRRLGNMCCLRRRVISYRLEDDQQRQVENQYIRDNWLAGWKCRTNNGSNGINIKSRVDDCDDGWVNQMMD